MRTLPLGWLFVAVVAALAIGIGVGALLAGDDGGSKSSDIGTVGTKPVALPDNLTGFRDIVDVVKSKSPSGNAVQQQTDHQKQVKESTEAAYSKAYGGAAAGYRGYSDAGLDKMPFVIAFRANSAGRTVGPVVDPHYLRVAKPQREVLDVGAVQCEVNWGFTAEGNPPNPSEESIGDCQRTGSGVTVIVGGAGFTGPADLKRKAALADAAWKAVSGS